MVKRLFFIFVILTLGLFFLFTGLLGDKGYLANRSLQRKINQMEYEIVRLDHEIENLSLKSSELSSEEGIRESALKFGYNISGDEVIIFGNSSKQKTEQKEEKQFIDFSEYIGLSSYKILIVAAASSVIITCLLALSFLRKKDKDEDIEEKNDSQQIQSGNDSDYLFPN